MHKIIRTTALFLSLLIAGQATASPFGLKFLHKGPPESVTYDTTMGASVDANGFTSLPLRAGAHLYFVNSSTGNDANNCTAAQSASTPKATLASGVGCMAAGVGDQVLVAEGTTYSEFIPYIGTGTKDGFSPLYPSVIQSYDPADPTNVAKYGRGDQRNARPIIAAAAPSSISNQGPNYFAIRGFDFQPPSNIPQGLSLSSDINPSHGANYFLAENNIFRYTTLAVTNGFQDAGLWTGSHFIVRNNGFFAPWDNRVPSSGNAQCLYIAGTSSATVEDNVFAHCGWKEGISRDESGYADHQTYVNAGGAAVFGHSFYIQTNTTGNIVRRNLSMDASGDCGNTRGDGTWSENVFIDCPAGISLGSGSPYTDRPNGVLELASFNAQIGTTGVSSTHQLGWGPSSANGYSGTRVDHNLLVRSPYFGVVGSGAQSGFSNFAGGTPLSSFAQYDHNLVWNWVDQASQLHSFYDEVDAYTPYVHSSYDYNNWDGTALGTNTNSTSTVFPNAYTEAGLFSALGYADVTALDTYAYQHPEAHIQRTALALLQAGYGITHPADVTAPTLSSPSASVSGSTVTLGVTTNEANGVLYAEIIKAYSATTPTTLAAPTPSSTGGSLATGPYYYVVTAITPSGETLASNEASVTLGGGSGTITGSVALSWSAVTGATDYHVYRGIFSGQDSAYYDVGNVTSYTDTWATVPVPGLPPGVPDAFHIKTAIDNSNTTATYSSSQTITTTGAKSFSATSMPSGTYYVHFIHEDAAGNKSTVATSGPFTV